MYYLMYNFVTVKVFDIFIYIAVITREINIKGSNISNTQIDTHCY